MWGLVSTKMLRNIRSSPITRPVVRVTPGFFVPLSTSDGALHGWRNPKAGSGVADPVEKGRFAACLRCFFSNAWADVGHEDGVDPVDDADVHVRHLERYGYLRVLRYVSVDDLSHHQDQANDGQNKWNHFHLNHYMCLRGLGCEWIALAHATF